MELIFNAILTGQRSVLVGGIMFERLPICNENSQVKRELFAENKAKELIKVLTNN